ncbi:MAG TPA: L-2-hydroxyglutarate oxidase [Cyclobacteriaceae bacterium]|nr:L-2-hydroxyglutarate oxidase [Cyclobacteriaceae bacterium]
MQDVIVIGGGIVGLATAYKTLLSMPSLKVTVLEKEDGLAKHQTGNNSGVIHSGIYYKPGSLKAKNCIDGYKQLLEFSRSNEVPHEICGKIILATRPEELNALDRIYARGMENGLSGLKKLNGDQIREIEPHVRGIAGIQVPQTGIINYRVLADKLAWNIKNMGGTIRLNEKVGRINNTGNSRNVQTTRGEYPFRLIVNCSGLYSDKIALLTGSPLNIKIIPFRGEYYRIRTEKKFLVKNLVYPVPDPNFPFLGVHFTRMIDGNVEAGPNAVFAYAREGYRKTDIHPGELAESIFWPGFRKIVSKYWKTGLDEMIRSYSKKAFTRALQRMIPEITEDDLVKGGSGVRAQACDRNGFLLDDFLILENDMAINVCNAPSPAATSSLSIGTYISQKIFQRFA